MFLRFSLLAHPSWHTDVGIFQYLFQSPYPTGLFLFDFVLFGFIFTLWTLMTNKYFISSWYLCMLYVHINLIKYSTVHMALNNNCNIYNLRLPITGCSLQKYDILIFRWLGNSVAYVDLIRIKFLHIINHWNFMI